MNRFMKISMIAVAIVGMTSLSVNTPAEAHHNNNNNAYANQLAMQMYANNLAIQQQQAAYYGNFHHNCLYNNGYNAAYAQPNLWQRMHLGY
jgi:hypothetical protein